MPRETTRRLAAGEQGNLYKESVKLVDAVAAAAATGAAAEGIRRLKAFTGKRREATEKFQQFTQVTEIESRVYTTNCSAPDSHEPTIMKLGNSSIRTLLKKATR